MKIQRLATVLTVINLVVLASLLLQVRSTVAQDPPPVLRGRALEIVDAKGRVRARIDVHPAGPAVPVPDGKTYPDTVVLRLIDPNGRPGVKIAASEQGAGLSLVGEAEPAYVVLKAEGATSTLKLSNRDGREHLVEVK
jgi:hypothetical protein